MIQKEGLSLAMDIIQESFREGKLQNFHEKRTFIETEKLEQRQKMKWKKIKKKWNDKTVQASVGEALDQD